MQQFGNTRGVPIWVESGNAYYLLLQLGRHIVARALVENQHVHTAIFQDLAIFDRQLPTVNKDYARANWSWMAML